MPVRAIQIRRPDLASRPPAALSPGNWLALRKRANPGVHGSIWSMPSFSGSARSAGFLARLPTVLGGCLVGSSGEHGGRVREIEVKYCVEDLEALLIALKARGIELSEPIYQDDQAYAPAGWQFGDKQAGRSSQRLRTVDGRHYFALKQPGENAQACLEYETEVADREAMHGGIVHMGTGLLSALPRPAAWPPWSTARCVSMISKAWVASWSLSAWYPMT